MKSPIIGFVFDVEDVVKVSTGERGYAALQGEDDL